MRKKYLCDDLPGGLLLYLLNLVLWGEGCIESSLSSSSLS